MRILRIRRGFTTNSSASSEWLPGAPTPDPSQGLAGNGGTGPTISTTSGSYPRPQSNASGDAVKVGGLIAIVALVFTAHRVGRAIFKGKASSNLTNSTPKNEGDDD